MILVLAAGQDMSAKVWSENTVLYFNTLLNKNVKVNCCNGKIYSGYVCTIDPVTCSLLIFNEDKKTVQCILGHSVQNVEVGDDTLDFNKTICCEFMAEQVKVLYELKEIETKKKNLVKWLKKYKLPVTENIENPDVLSIAGAVQIIPPYDASSCRSTNEIILSRVQSLIASQIND